MSWTVLDRLVGSYTPVSGRLTPNEQGLLVSVLDALNETRERAGQDGYLFLFRGSIEDVKNRRVLTPLNDRWWKR